MQVLYVVYKLLNGRESPCAVVTSKAGVEPPYSVQEFPLTTSAEQQSASKAFNEIAKLSEEARLKLGLSPEKLSAIQKQADPGISLKPGDTVYLSIFCGEDGRSAPRAEGVFSYKPPTDAFTGSGTFTLEPRFASFLYREGKEKPAKEISALSKETKQFLKDFKP
jgi:hypothetical protein